MSLMKIMNEIDNFKIELLSKILIELKYTNHFNFFETCLPRYQITWIL